MAAQVGAAGGALGEGELGELLKRHPLTWSCLEAAGWVASDESRGGGGLPFLYWTLRERGVGGQALLDLDRQLVAEQLGIEDGEAQDALLRAVRVLWLHCRELSRQQCLPEGAKREFEDERRLLRSLPASAHDMQAVGERKEEEGLQRQSSLTAEQAERASSDGESGRVTEGRNQDDEQAEMALDKGQQGVEGEVEGVASDVVAFSLLPSGVCQSDAGAAAQRYEAMELTIESEAATDMTVSLLDPDISLPLAEDRNEMLPAVEEERSDITLNCANHQRNKSSPVADKRGDDEVSPLENSHHEGNVGVVEEGTLPKQIRSNGSELLSARDHSSSGHSGSERSRERSDIAVGGGGHDDEAATRPSSDASSSKSRCENNAMTCEYSGEVVDEGAGDAGTHRPCFNCSSSEQSQQKVGQDDTQVESPVLEVNGTTTIKVTDTQSQTTSRVAMCHDRKLATERRASLSALRSRVGAMKRRMAQQSTSPPPPPPVLSPHAVDVVEARPTGPTGAATRGHKYPVRWAEVPSRWSISRVGSSSVSPARHRLADGITAVETRQSTSPGRFRPCSIDAPPAVEIKGQSRASRSPARCSWTHRALPIAHIALSPPTKPSSDTIATTEYTSMHFPAPKYSSMEVTSDNNDQRSPRRRFSFSASQESAAKDETISLGQRSPLERSQTKISLHPASQGVDERSRNSDASSSAHADDGAADSSDGLERTLPQWVAWKGSSRRPELKNKVRPKHVSGKSKAPHRDPQWTFEIGHQTRRGGRQTEWVMRTVWQDTTRPPWLGPEQEPVYKEFQTGANVTPSYKGTSSASAGELPPFHAAAVSGDVKALRRLLRKPPPIGAPLLVAVNEINSAGQTALHKAVSAGHSPATAIALAEALLCAGADVNSADAYGRTPLHFAVQQWFGSTEDAADCAAARKHHCAVLSPPHFGVSSVTAVDRTRSSKWQQWDGGPASGQAGSARLHHYRAVVELLLTAGADPNAADNQGETAIHKAVLSYRAQGFRDILLQLTSAGADVDAVNVKGRRALHLAALRSQVDAMQCLITQGADTNAADNGGRTPLHLVARHCSNEKRSMAALKLLMEFGADEALRDVSGRTAGDLARLRSMPRISRALPSRGDPIAAPRTQPRDEDDPTPSRNRWSRNNAARRAVATPPVPAFITPSPERPAEAAAARGGTPPIPMTVYVAPTAHPVESPTASNVAPERVLISSLPSSESTAAMGTPPVGVSGPGEARDGVELPSQDGGQAFQVEEAEARQNEVDQKLGQGAAQFRDGVSNEYEGSRGAAKQRVSSTARREGVEEDEGTRDDVGGTGLQSPGDKDIQATEVKQELDPKEAPVDRDTVADRDGGMEGAHIGCEPNGASATQHSGGSEDDAAIGKEGGVDRDGHGHLAAPDASGTGGEYTPQLTEQESGVKVEQSQVVSEQGSAGERAEAVDRTESDDGKSSRSRDSASGKSVVVSAPFSRVNVVDAAREVAKDAAEPPVAVALERGTESAAPLTMISTWELHQENALMDSMDSELEMELPPDLPDEMPTPASSVVGGGGGYRNKKDKAEGNTEEEGTGSVGESSSYGGGSLLLETARLDEDGELILGVVAGESDEEALARLTAGGVLEEELFDELPSELSGLDESSAAGSMLRSLAASSAAEDTA